MSQDPLTEKLAQANGNVKKLCEFFAARSHWTLPTDGEPSARDAAAAADKLAEHLRVLIRAAGSDPRSSFEPLVETQDSGTHDCARLDRFTAFLRDLDAWLVAQPGPSTDPEVIAAFQEMESYVFAIGELTGALTGESEAPAAEIPATEAPAPSDDGTTLAADPDGAAHGTIASTPEGVPLQLALDDTDEHPMVQEFQGMNELTEECKKLIDGFLAAWSLEYSYYNRKKLLERILRWINSAPEGHVLVIKMKTVEEPYQPYPSYISRAVLAGNPPTKDPLS
jgi:hypothetical protein